MLKTIYLELFGSADTQKNSINELEKLMQVINGKIKIDNMPEIKRCIIQLEYDAEEIDRKIHRDAGRSSKHFVERNEAGKMILGDNGKYSQQLKLTELEKMIKKDGAEAVAKKYGMGMSTLYRKIKKARDAGQESVE